MNWANLGKHKNDQVEETQRVELDCKSLLEQGKKSKIKFSVCMYIYLAKEDEQSDEWIKRLDTQTVNVTRLHLTYTFELEVQTQLLWSCGGERKKSESNGKIFHSHFVDLQLLKKKPKENKTCIGWPGTRTSKEKPKNELKLQNEVSQKSKKKS